MSNWLEHPLRMVNGSGFLNHSGGLLRKARTTIHTQVAAQYGKDSNELAAVGLKKTSEYKPRTRKADTAG